MQRRITLLSALLLLAAITFPIASTAAPSQQSGTNVAGTDDTRDVGSDLNAGQPMPIRNLTKARIQKLVRAAEGPSGAAKYKVGDKRTWLALDDLNGFLYLKEYKLRGVGEHIEVWVAADKDKTSKRLKFPQGDCRNGERTKITNEQVNYLIDEFDTNIYPKESVAYSVPPDRNGQNAPLAEQIGVGRNYWRGQGDNIVTLIDNVRDQNFYNEDNENEYAYIAGFFASFFNDLLNRNVMTIDGYDWLHRTGASPPNEPVPGDPCKSKPARPFLYEGVFAHEYQHLLESYEDEDETTWVNEGLADWAQTLTGYVDPSQPIDNPGFESGIQCFLGYSIVETPANPNPREGGPENSLTLWGDQVADHQAELLCDYGAAYTLMELLAGRYGQDFMSSLHRDDANGLASLGALLTAVDATTSAAQVLHEWAAMVALDGVIDDGAVLTGGNPAKYTVPTLDATINWDNPETYDNPGAPPNGSDYVRLRDAGGGFLPASGITSIEFDGAETLPPFPVEWEVDSSPPKHKKNEALYSGRGDNFDRSIVRQVSVPADNATLSFKTRYNMEELFDYGVVQVSTDGGQTYTTLENKNTTSEHDAIPPNILEALPGFNGKAGWHKETFDLSAYAGQDVLLAFRYLTDSGVSRPGWWIDKVKVGGEVVSDGSSLDGWQTMTQINPNEVAGFTVQIISYNEARTEAHIAQLQLNDTFQGSLSGAALQTAIGTNAEVVAAIVFYDEPTESLAQYAPYVLEVNGVLQPGGS
jgi:Immune inhibitor A peptidase M6